MSEISKFSGAILTDILSALMVPGASTAGELLQNIFKRRIEKAREILIQEIRGGENDILNVEECDEVVAIVYRYMRAAQEGAARMNLRLLARIIAGQKALKALKADEFLYYADLIASLRHEEIVLLGSYARVLAIETKVVRENSLDPSRAENSAERRATKSIEDVLIPDVFSSRSELWATVNAVSRTGLMTIASPSFDGPYFELTPIFTKVNVLVSFEDLEA
ncbi:MAG: hypothetical protein JO126_04950 [Alphaproteobacteria bacterium]|nr:hypothetical protein [Alphaproteobacteria bacterium]